MYNIFSSNNSGRYALITGDLESDPITIQQKQQKKSAITRLGRSKYFKVIVTDTGKLTVKFTSDSLKKDGTLTLIYDDNGVYYDQVDITYNKKAKKQSHIPCYCLARHLSRI